MKLRVLLVEDDELIGTMVEMNLAQAGHDVTWAHDGEAALEAVMKNGAEMMGYGDRMGTIEPGKIANLIVTDGNPLEIQTEILDLFILGRQVSTDNKHKSLYEKYRSRPRDRIIS